MQPHENKYALYVWSLALRCHILVDVSDIFFCSGEGVGGVRFLLKIPGGVSQERGGGGGRGAGVCGEFGGGGAKYFFGGAEMPTKHMQTNCLPTSNGNTMNAFATSSALHCIRNGDMRQLWNG